MRSTNIFGIVIIIYDHPKTVREGKIRKWSVYKQVSLLSPILRSSDDGTPVGTQTGVVIRKLPCNIKVDA